MLCETFTPLNSDMTAVSPAMPNVLTSDIIFPRDETVPIQILELCELTRKCAELSATVGLQPLYVPPILVDVNHGADDVRKRIEFMKRDIALKESEILRSQILNVLLADIRNIDADFTLRLPFQIKNIYRVGHPLSCTLQVKNLAPSFRVVSFDIFLFHYATGEMMTNCFTLTTARCASPVTSLFIHGNQLQADNSCTMQFYLNKGHLYQSKNKYLKDKIYFLCGNLTVMCYTMSAGPVTFTLSLSTVPFVSYISLDGFNTGEFVDNWNSFTSEYAFAPQSQHQPQSQFQPQPSLYKAHTTVFNSTASVQEEMTAATLATMDSS